jgi:uncharacterized membrane protein
VELLILFLSGLASGIVYILDKKISEGKHQADAFTILTLSLNVIVSLPLFFVNFYISSDKWVWVMIIFSGLAYGLSRVFLYKAYQNSDASSVGIIHKLNIVVGALFGIIILHESYSYLAYLGLFLILISSVLVLYKGGKIEFDKGAIYALMMVLYFLHGRREYLKRV